MKTTEAIVLTICIGVFLMGGIFMGWDIAINQ